jgi:hypothetical protein
VNGNASKPPLGSRFPFPRAREGCGGIQRRGGGSESIGVCDEVRAGRLQPARPLLVERRRDSSFLAFFCRPKKKWGSRRIDTMMQHGAEACNTGRGHATRGGGGGYPSWTVSRTTSSAVVRPWNTNCLP